MAKSKVITMEIFWKNPDAPEALREWGDYGEYFGATCTVNLRTGKGAIQLHEAQIPAPKTELKTKAEISA